jgi:hypothetical protein
MSIQAPALFSAEETARMQCVCIIVSNAIPTGGDSQSIDDWFAHVEALMVQPVIPTRALHPAHSARIARKEALDVIFENITCISVPSPYEYRALDALHISAANA